MTHWRKAMSPQSLLLIVLVLMLVGAMLYRMKSKRQDFALRDDLKRTVRAVVSRSASTRAGTPAQPCAAIRHSARGLGASVRLRSSPGSGTPSTTVLPTHPSRRCATPLASCRPSCWSASRPSIGCARRCVDRIRARSAACGVPASVRNKTSLLFAIAQSPAWHAPTLNPCRVRCACRAGSFAQVDLSPSRHDLPLCKDSP